ncbi:ADP-ribosylglycohydrolase family protein [Lentisphaera araneosa]|nr:ADP-ribosylglycohydrolase family protein [Lentisphaera araneosa]
MFGLILRDALGVPVEFMERDDLKQRPVVSMRGFGSHNKVPGTWSDDSSMVLCKLHSILEQACLRELHEETSLDLRHRTKELKHLIDLEGMGRDPRDNDLRWSRTSVFMYELREDEHGLMVSGGDDAFHAFWFCINDLPWNLAFDHSDILAKAFPKIAPLPK